MEGQDVLGRGVVLVGEYGLIITKTETESQNRCVSFC